MTPRNSIKWCGGLLLACIGTALGAGCCENREVIVEWTPKPDKQDILKTDAKNRIRVCVPSVEVRWTYPTSGESPATPVVFSYIFLTGFPGTPTSAPSTTVLAAWQDRQAKWMESLVTSRIRAKLQERANAEGMFVDFVDRDALGMVVREEDLRNAGITEEVGQKIKQLNIDLWVFGTLDVFTVIEISSKRDMWARIANLAPYVPNVFDDGPKPQIRRTITFAGDLRAVDAKTAKLWFNEPFAKQDVQDEKPIPVVGSGKTQADLVPEEGVVKAMLEEAADLFVSRLVAIRFCQTFTVTSSTDPDCREGVELLRDDPPAALELFENALKKNPKDKEALFGAGVALELLARLAEARDKYQLAKDLAKAKDTDRKGFKGQCVASLRRINQRMERTEVIKLATARTPSAPVATPDKPSAKK